MLHLTFVRITLSPLLGLLFITQSHYYICYDYIITLIPLLGLQYDYIITLIPLLGLQY